MKQKPYHGDFSLNTPIRSMALTGWLWSMKRVEKKERRQSFLCGIADKKSCFINRLHEKFPWKSIGKEKYSGKVKTGKVYEQPILVVDETGKEWKFRLIRICLKKPTRDGQKEIFIVTNLSKSAAHAKKIADLYRKRWKIETAFQELAKHLNSEINTEISNMVFQLNGFPQFTEFSSVFAEPSEFSIYGKHIKRYVFNKLTVVQCIDI